METSIYALLDPVTNETRYVGKTNKLAGRHKDHCSAKGNTHRDCWVRSLRPLIPIIIELEKTKEWQEAEIFWISYLKSLGARLTNHTIGGDGVTGYIFTDEVKKVIGEKSRLSHLAPERKAQRIAALKATMSQPGVRENQARNTKLALANPETRKMMSEKSAAWQNTPEAKAARSIIAKEIWDRPGLRERVKVERANRPQSYKDNMSCAIKAKYEDPEFRAKQKAAMENPETRAKISEYASSRPPKSAETRAKMAISIKATMSTPEYKAKRSAIATEMWRKRREG